MKYWTEQEDSFLRENYCKMTNTDLGKELGRSKRSVQMRLHTLKMKRPTEIRRKFSAKTQFKKGHPTWNKGMKGWCPSGSEATQFKKGQLPHNTKEDGAISIRYHRRDNRAYKYIRVAKAKWELLHRVNWEKANGPIPKTHVVGFRDGDTLNCDLDNLYCISKADNCRRNSSIENDGKVAFWISPRNKELREQIKKEAPELIELKRAELKLRRVINEQQSNQ